MNKNIISGSVVLAFAIIFTIMAFRLPPSPSGSVVIGPSVFPGAIGILLILTSIILIISGLVELRQNKSKIVKVKGEQEEGEQQDKKKVILISLILFGYVVLFVPLGYVISTVLFILGLSMYLDRKHWIRNIIYSLVFSITVYFVFDRLLSVYLPLGPLG
ncbi:tripartite tricarboxylate transporter TctB family protein [Bacillus sp. JJ1566]|uniref:tripartite tricarboxylate transporter TctB family protein n=1 Tax=Bacillus sp. JJ1566 TaxID=3122961 RepID=UPI002FFF95E2